MLITKISSFTGVTHSREIPVTDEQYLDWENGRPIQYAMPHLSPDDREFIKTGITPEEWDTFWGENQ